MTLDAQDLTLTVERTIKAPPEIVFDAWLTPETLIRFMCPEPGMDAPDVETDAKVGGTFKIVMKQGDTEIPHTGTYHEIDRPNRLVFTWVSPFSVEGSTVTLEFRAKGEGTHVTLTQTRFENAERRDQHRGGWTRILDRLEEAL